MGRDPWLTYYDGNYYLAATTGTSVLTMHKSPSLEGLKIATLVTIYFETDASASSIESVNFPGFYLRHQNNTILLMQDHGSETFAGEATWWVRAGLAESSATSFEAYDQPGSYIGKLFGITSLTKITRQQPISARSMTRPLHGNTSGTTLRAASCAALYERFSRAVWL